MTEQAIAEQAMAEQAMAKQAMAEQTMAEQAMAEQAMAEQERAEQAMVELAIATRWVRCPAGQARPPRRTPHACYPPPPPPPHQLPADALCWVCGGRQRNHEAFLLLKHSRIFEGLEVVPPPPHNPALV